PGDDARPVAPAAAALGNSTARCGYQAAISIAKNLPLVLVVCGRHDVAENFERALHRSNPGLAIFYRRRRNDFGHRLTEPRDSNRLLRCANLFQQSQALGFELRDGDFLHTFPLWSFYHTMVILSDYSM